MPVTVLITGGGSGIGRGLCHCFAEKGYRVVCGDLDFNAAEVTSRSSSHAENIHPVILDVTSEDNVREVVEGVAGSIGILVNNAGIQHVAPLESFPQDAWDRVVDVLLRGTCLMTRSVLGSMREEGWGRIVNIGSIHSLVASPFKSAYVAAKHGLLGFSKVVALETAESDITINTVCPSYIRTPLVENQIAAQAENYGITPEEVVDQIMLAPMPKRRFISIEEIAGTIEFLASPSARNITGQEIVIDGGWTVR
jgi:3-hydroxybutyrate dehydrogenase